jgi:hypothetical protein
VTGAVTGPRVPGRGPTPHENVQKCTILQPQGSWGLTPLSPPFLRRSPPFCSPLPAIPPFSAFGPGFGHLSPPFPSSPAQVPGVNGNASWSEFWGLRPIRVPKQVMPSRPSPVRPSPVRPSPVRPSPVRPSPVHPSPRSESDRSRCAQCPWKVPGSGSLRTARIRGADSDDTARPFRATEHVHWTGGARRRSGGGS